jgi:hypothetical protein
MCTLILVSVSWRFSLVLSLSCKKLCFGLGDDEVCIYGVMGRRMQNKGSCLVMGWLL